MRQSVRVRGPRTAERALGDVVVQSGAASRPEADNAPVWPGVLVDHRIRLREQERAERPREQRVLGGLREEDRAHPRRARAPRRRVGARHGLIASYLAP